MISQHLPILQIVVPLLAAPLCVLLRQRHAVWAFALGVCWASFGVALALLLRVMNDGPLVYELGGWAAPWGIVYRLDPLGGIVLLIVSGVAALVLVFAPRVLDQEIPADKHYLFFAAFLLCMTGLLGITITGDIFNVFVFLEISSLSAYVLISMGADRRALLAAYRYLVMGTIGSTFILIGIGLAYMMTGTLNMADLAARLGDVHETRTIRAAFAFLTVGVSIKLALFPLHVWLPNAYTYAPSMVTAFLAATATKVSCYLLLRLVFTVFGVPLVFDEMRLAAVFMPLALMAIFVASTVAIFQTNVKRLLAYSSVAQIGYLVLAFGFASQAGVTACVIHLFNHALMKGALFLALGCVAFRIGSVDLEDLRGLGRRMPWIAALIVIGGLNLIGVPLTAGFISKWYLVMAALEQREYWPVAVAMLFSSLLAVAYVWRIVEVLYMQPPRPSDLQSDQREAPVPLSMVAPTTVMTLGTVVLGVYPTFTVQVAQRAAEFLLGVAA